MASSFNGIGTTFYGQCDFEDDSYITTRWFILGYVPIVPLSSTRVILQDGSFLSSSYEVVSEEPLHLMQVLRTYLYVIFLVGAFVAVMEKHRPVLTFFSMAVLVSVPTIARWLAKNNRSERPPVRNLAERPRAPERVSTPAEKISTCPKCQYTRKPEDHAPEWQCPSCQVAYNKVTPAALAERGRSVSLQK